MEFAQDVPITKFTMAKIKAAALLFLLNADSMNTSISAAASAKTDTSEFLEFVSPALCTLHMTGTWMPVCAMQDTILWESKCLNCPIKLKIPQAPSHRIQPTSTRPMDHPPVDLPILRSQTSATTTPAESTLMVSISITPMWSMAAHEPT